MNARARAGVTGARARARAARKLAFSLRASYTGVMARHGGHHVAEKSTMTSFPVFRLKRALSTRCDSAGSRAPSAEESASNSTELLFGARAGRSGDARDQARPVLLAVHRLDAAARRSRRRRVEACNVLVYLKGDPDEEEDKSPLHGGAREKGARRGRCRQNLQAYKGWICGRYIQRARARNGRSAVREAPQRRRALHSAYVHSQEPPMLGRLAQCRPAGLTAVFKQHTTRALARSVRV